jgi:hypothetical protein
MVPVREAGNQLPVIQRNFAVRGLQKRAASNVVGIRASVFLAPAAVGLAVVVLAVIALVAGLPTYLAGYE